MAAGGAASLLTSVDSLFTTQAQRDEAPFETIVQLPSEQISDFPDHPFKVLMDDKMAELVDSVRQYGILVPAIVRPAPDGGYQMVAGHRRKRASELAGVPLPCIVRNLSDDEATIIMVDSNLQREKLLPSEKAFAYKMKQEAMKRQGQRTDLTLSPVATKLDTASAVGQQCGESRDQVFRYIRLTYLVPDLLALVDDDKIAMRPAVELSYLSPEEQAILYEIIQAEDCTPSHAQAIRLRQLSKDGNLSARQTLSVMQEQKPNQKEHFRMPRERISKYFPPGTPAQKIEDTIIKALELYRKRQREQSR
ncbi:MAG: ParB/RepB/Spo0J family partition protein [Ruminococcaceae bacterium]|nr:ParB/RepB/Spo0J family partition protein [Oscillospiraceae bacterium]